MRKLHLLMYAMLAMFFVACSSDDNTSGGVEIVGNYTNGIFVVNEGNFGTGNSDVSFIDANFSSVDNNIFSDANQGQALGDVAQSITLYEDLAFVVVNNSDKVAVVDRHSFELISTVEGQLSLPRYMAISNGKGYITNWDENDDAYVSVVDLETYTVTETIDVDFGPEKIIEKDGRVYVAHQGGFGQNNKLTVIDTNSDSVIDVLEVGDVPNSLQIVGNDLWVLAGGNPSWAATGETDGKLVKIDMGSLEITQEFDFEGISASLLEYDQGRLYYTVSITDWDTYETEAHVFAFDPNSTSLPTESVFSTDRAFYGAAIKDGMYFGGDAKDYASDGSVVIYDLENGEQLYEFTVGITPNGFYFTE